MKNALIITGASGGIGKVLCQYFRKRSYKVIAIDIKDESETADLTLKLNLSSLPHSADEQAYLRERVHEFLKQEKAQLKGLINNAAVQILNPCQKLTFDDWNQSLSVNLLAPFFLIQIFSPDLSLSKGSIVNISSIHEKLTKAGFTAYASSKAALSEMTRALALELSPTININAICPAAIETEMLQDGFAGQAEAYESLKRHHPIGRIGEPEEVANLCYYLIHNAPAFLSGSTLDLSGGINGVLHDPS